MDVLRIHALVEHCESEIRSSFEEEIDVSLRYACVPWRCVLLALLERKDKIFFSHKSPD